MFPYVTAEIDMFPWVTVALTQRHTPLFRSDDAYKLGDEDRQLSSAEEEEEEELDELFHLDTSSLGGGGGGNGLSSLAEHEEEEEAKEEARGGDFREVSVSMRSHADSVSAHNQVGEHLSAQERCGPYVVIFPVSLRSSNCETRPPAARTNSRP